MKLHPECFKIKDSRMEAVAAGKMSLQAFALSLRAEDPFVLINDTIYALTKDEFYSTRSIKRIYDESEQTFKHVLALTDLSFMEQQDRDFVEKVRKELPTCPVCKYRRYRNAIYRLAKHYKLAIDYVVDGIIDSVSYPATTEDVKPIVTTLLDHLYDLPKHDRQPCINCVEKHVAQAYILAQESEMGYPEHRILMCGHLAEAIDEAPNDIPELKYTLQMCMSTTMQDGKAFLPLYPILALIKMVRERINQQPVDSDMREEAPMVTDTIELVPEIQDELKKLPSRIKTKVWGDCVDIKNSILEYKVSKKEEPRIRFEGLVANLAEAVLTQAPLFASMLRNRRLLFVADPALAVDAGYNFDDIIELVSH
jgi:hypothetical protein